MKRTIAIALALALVSSLGLVPAVPVAAQVSEVWVDDDALVEWYLDGTHFAIIQEGIAAVAPDGIVNVAPGTYGEAVFINQSLTLLGAKADDDARTRDTASGESIVDGSDLGLDAGVGAFNIADGVSGVIIDGFEVCDWPASSNPGNGSAVMAYSYGEATQGLSQITIQNNYMHDLGWNGVLVWSNNEVVQDDFTIQFNLIEGAPYAGIELTNVINSEVLNNKVIAPTAIANDPGDAGVGIEIAVRAQPGIAISAGNVLVEDNEISGAFPEGSRAGINILSRTYASNSTAILTEVIVRDNIVSADVIVGILAVAESRLGGPATISSLQIVDGNVVSGFSKTGIVAKDVDSVQIEGNTVSSANHSLATNGIQIGYLIDGFPCATGTTGAIVGNQVSDCHWEGYDPSTETYEDDWTASGILVLDTESSLAISDNEVQGCDVGLDLEMSGALIGENDVHDNSYGFVLWNANPSISLNNIYENPQGGVYRTTAGSLEGILDATNNWWGTTNGETIATMVSGEVTYEPWLTESYPPKPKGGGGISKPPPGTTKVSGDVDSKGTFEVDVTATSKDKLCSLTIPEGTVGLTEGGTPLRRITMEVMDEPPPPPEDADVIGLPYDFGPDGATFNPPITLTWSYDPDVVPEGLDLVIAFWDGDEWVELENCVVDLENNTITADVSHFTAFTVIARAPEVVVAPPVEVPEELVPPEVVVPEVVPPEEAAPPAPPEPTIPPPEPAGRDLRWLIGVAVFCAIFFPVRWWRRSRR